MRNPTDAALITTNTWQRAAAKGLAAGLTEFLDDHKNSSHAQKYSRLALQGGPGNLTLPAEGHLDWPSSPA